MTYPPYPPPQPQQPEPSWPPVQPEPGSAPPVQNSYTLYGDPGAQPDPSYPAFPQSAEPYAGAPDPYAGGYAGAPDPYAGQPPVAPVGPFAGPPVPARARGERTPAVLVSIGIGLALLGLIIVLASPKTFFSGSDPDSAGAIPAAEPTTIQDLTGGPFTDGEDGSATPSASASAQPSTPSGPERRDLPARTIVGPSFAAGEDTYPMKLNGMPFAFNTPPTWGCIKASINVLPEALVWRCIDEQAGSGRPQIDLVAVKCASACTGADRDNVDSKALSPVPKYTTKDATTRYAERTDAGKYALTVNHTFAVNGQNWVLLLDAEASKAEHKPGVQKTVNDIWSQTP
jgi:hypothetical protein